MGQDTPWGARDNPILGYHVVLPLISSHGGPSPIHFDTKKMVCCDEDWGNFEGCHRNP